MQAKLTGASPAVREMEQIVRLGFVRKVYGILFIQLLVTAAVMWPFSAYDEVKNYCFANSWVVYTAMAINFVTLIAITCCGDLGRKYPTNYVLLSIFTVTEAIFLGVICSTYQTDSVLIAVGMTVLVVLGLTVFAWQTKIDFTMMGGAIFACLWVLILFGLFSWFFVTYENRRILDIVYCSIGVLVFSLYIVYDTQLMIGNLGSHQHKVQFGIDDYVFAALNLYLDVINMFLFILRLVGGRRD